MGSELGYVLDAVSRGFGAGLCLGRSESWVRSWPMSWMPWVVGSELAYVLDAYHHLYPDDF